MGYYLGIDGGGTGCRALLVDADGAILARGDGGPANVNSDLVGSYGSIMAVSEQILSQTGVSAAQISAVLGLAGANVTAQAEAFAAMLPFGQLRILSDGQTAARGALGRQDGIMAAIGTGSVFAAQYGGQFRQVGGRGFVLGDEGSGASLGRLLLADVLRAEDGLIAMTPLLAEILAEFGSAEAIIAFGFEASPGAFGRFAPRLVAAASDPAAAHILDLETDRVAAILDNLQQHSGAALPVSFVGGLGAVFAERLGPRYRQVPAAGSGVEGALAIAREMFA